VNLNGAVEKSKLKIPVVLVSVGEKIWKNRFYFIDIIQK